MLSDSKSVRLWQLKLALFRNADAAFDEWWTRRDVTSGQRWAVSMLLAQSDVTIPLSFNGGSVELKNIETIVDRRNRHDV